MTSNPLAIQTLLDRLAQRRSRLRSVAGRVPGDPQRSDVLLDARRRAILAAGLAPQLEPAPAPSCRRVVVGLTADQFEDLTQVELSHRADLDLVPTRPE